MGTRMRIHLFIVIVSIHFIRKCLAQIIGQSRNIVILVFLIAISCPILYCGWAPTFNSGLGIFITKSEYKI